MEIIAQFMTFDTIVDSVQVFRYSIVDGIYRLEIAQLEVEADFSEAKHGEAVVAERQNGWDWIGDFGPSEDVQTYWSFTSDYEGQFEPGFEIEDMKATGICADTYADLIKVLSNEWTTVLG